MHTLARLDHRHVWHPFTQMRDWLRREPIVIVSGQGAVLRDVHGREYLDGNASIWTNLHGHNHPKINAALERQLSKIAHSSALGLANEPASRLAERLVRLANLRIYDLRLTIDEAAESGVQNSRNVHPPLTKVFFSDDGSTALEVALKLAYEFTRRKKGRPRPRFLSLAGAYHGDTVGAVSLGHISLFHKAYAGLLFRSDAVMAPYCYRCPYNRARPERADARAYRVCRWECVDRIEEKSAAQKKRGNPYAAFVFEPLIQGAAGMIPQPSDWLQRATDIARGHGTLLIADEVMTGFGRTGVDCRKREGKEPKSWRPPRRPPLFACQHAGVQPDFLCLAKGLTGGYLPMAATLTTQEVFDAFLGEHHRTFFHGHSYTANQLGASAALASLDVLQTDASIRARARLQQTLSAELQALWSLPSVGDIRQVGLMVGVELVKDWRRRTPFDLRERAGFRVCEALARRGVLTRPIGNVVVLMPPYGTTRAQARRMIAALGEAIAETFPVAAG